MESQLQDFAPLNKCPHHERFVEATVSPELFSHRGSLSAGSLLRRRLVDRLAARHPPQSHATSWSIAVVGRPRLHTVDDRRGFRSSTATMYSTSVMSSTTAAAPSPKFSSVAPSLFFFLAAPLSLYSQLQDFAPLNKCPRHESFIGATVSPEPFSLRGSLSAGSPHRATLWTVSSLVVLPTAMPRPGPPLLLAIRACHVVCRLGCSLV
ncbi:hypothetical protein Syun_029311 [Stephania yunnanensis]|uniref:Uncharacterized protein n=1 Tax=Stephania yunnanensis TaxID=152371 RepID=A0AAP0E8R4_9MAGN